MMAFFNAKTIPLPSPPPPPQALSLHLQQRSCFSEKMVTTQNTARRNKPGSIYTFQFVRGVRESCLGTHGSVCSVSPPVTFFTSFWLKEEGGLWKLWSSRACKLPRLVGLSRSPETEVCIRVLASSRNYYIKDLRNIRKSTIYYTPIPAVVRHHVNPVISHVLPLTLARDVTSVAP
jgi:hypothetical protein